MDRSDRSGRTVLPFRFFGPVGRRCRPYPFLCRPLCQLVAPLIEGMPRMARHPFPSDLMFAGQGRELLPEILILQSFRGLQATGADPALKPFAHPPDQVL